MDLIGLIQGFFFICFLLVILGMTLHAVSFVHLFFIYHKNRTRFLRPIDRFDKSKLPYQLIQLPVYNEDPYLVTKLIDSACRQTYPCDRLFIQLLDDSDINEISDKLYQYVISKTSQLSDHINLSYHHRSERTEFKAGNLNHGLRIAEKIFADQGIKDNENIIVSIFDADFTMPPNYLLETVDYFKDPKIGVVQAFLEYENADMNCLTRTQACFLNNLHLVDFSARSLQGYLTIFRGSAGSLRLSAIKDAGYWQGDTQVEDIDLSFEVQNQGWKILYINHLSVKSQLPKTLDDFKLQQRSWMKGIMEVMKKKIIAILKSPVLSCRQKLSAIDFFFILSLQAFFIIIIHLVMIPNYYLFKQWGYPHLMNQILLGLFILFSFTHIPFLITPLGSRSPKLPGTKIKWTAQIIDRLVAFMIMIAMFIPLFHGLIEGMLGVKVHRDRTLKYDPDKKDGFSQLHTISRTVISRIHYTDMIMSLYSIFFLVWAIWEREWIIAGIFILLAIPYSISVVINLFCPHVGSDTNDNRFKFRITQSKK